MNNENNEFFQASHLMLLVGYSFFAAILIGESILMGWEKWVLVLIVGGMGLSWLIHIRHMATADFRLWIYALLMMFAFFFYGIHLTSTFDLAVVMAAIIILYTMTGHKSLITLCQFTYFFTMGYSLIKMLLAGVTFDELVITRSALHCAMIIMIGWASKAIIDRLIQVYGNTREEIAKLTDATQRLNDFLANMSHELRTPINAVIGLSGVCIDREENPEIQSDMIAVRTAGRRVARQIGDILDFSEIDRGKLVSNSEDYMLSSVLHDLVTEIREFKPHHLELIIDVDPMIPAVMNTDVEKLKKILRALISNGLKYTQKGGVYVRIASEKQSYGVNLFIEVTDTGIGMSDETLERVYESFYQVDSGTARSGGGLGLGLSIVNGFVSLLGGFMTIRSKAGVGTTVHVSLPQKVINSASCMSVDNPAKLCLGAYLHFEKYPNPAVREYYNSVVLNIVNGLGVQMHRVNNAENLKKLRESLPMTHLFVGEEEYCSDIEYMEMLAKELIVIVVADSGFKLPPNSRAIIMEKPFYCFPVVSILNTDLRKPETGETRMYCNGIRALVVDDEPMNLVVAKSIFRRYRMEVDTVNSGYEAIDICREKSYDIIFMDHMMSGMDGVEAMKRLRSDVSGLANSIPIVVLTANAMSSARQMFMAEGFDGFVSKPIETEELERVLRQVLPKQSITYERVEEYEQEQPSDTDKEKINSAFSADKAGRNSAGFADQENRNSTRFAEQENRSNVGVADKESRGTASSADWKLRNAEALKDCGIDMEVGLKYCLGDTEFYKSLLLQYAGDLKEKEASLEDYLEKKDLKNYEILIHALKSTSKMIGAMELSDEARLLEKAAKEKDEAYINENHVKAMKIYRSVVDGIYAIYGEASQKKPQEPGRDDGEILEFAPQ